MDFTPFIKAGLLQREVGDIVGVCRATVNRWYGQTTRPHHLIRSRVHEVLARVEAAVDKGALPLSPALQPADRKVKLVEVLAEYDE